MSQLRVNKIQSLVGTSGTITISGITTFSGTGAFAVYPTGDPPRPSSPVAGQIRTLKGDSGNVMEYYNGSFWAQI